MTAIYCFIVLNNFILWEKTGVLQLKQLFLEEPATLMEMELK